MTASRTLLREVARSLDAPVSLAPHLAELFADLSALGSMPRTVARLLREAGVGGDARVVDLACGKGAVAVEVARRVGARVLGLDAYEPFLEAGRGLARRRGVGGRCTFRTFDLRDPTTLPRGRFDAAMMIGLDPLELAAPVLRSLTRRGGVYIVDDLFRDDRHPRSARYTGVPSRGECGAFIAGLGDRVEAVHVPPPSEVRRLNDRLYRALAARSLALRGEHPRLGGALREFLSRQRRANVLLAGPLRPAIWVVRRGR